VIQKLRQDFSLELLLSIAQLPHATYYYHVKQLEKSDKYGKVKDEIAVIYHEHKGRYGYRRITTELHRRGFDINHKTVQRLMKETGIVCRVRMKKYKSYNGEIGKIVPNLLERDFETEKPNEK
jgi:transposase InsO family protein